MNREHSLLKNTVIISIGKICTSVITFLLLPLYTGILSAEEYGIVDLLNTLLSLIVPIITLQLEKAIFRELIDSRGDTKKRKTIITTGLFSTVIQCFIFILLFSVFGIFYSNDYSLFLELNIIAYIFLSLLQQVSRGLGRMTQYAVSNFISALSIIVFNILFLVVFNMGVYGMLLGTLFGYLLSFVYLFFALHVYKNIGTKSFSKPLLRSFLKYSLPLVPNSLAWWIFSASDRVIVSSILGLEQNGIMAASLKFSTIIITLYGIFDTSWIESISSNINDKDIDKFFNKIFNAVFVAFSSIGMLMIAFMPYIFPIMIDNSYSSGYWLIPITIFSSIFNVLQGMIAVVYAAEKNTRELSRTSVAAAIINIVTHLILIWQIGLFASVVSTLIALAMMFIYRVVNVSKKYFKINLDKKNAIIAAVFLLIITIVYYMNIPVLNIFSIITSVMFATYSNSKYIKTIKDIILRKVGKING